MAVGHVEDVEVEMSVEVEVEVWNGVVGRVMELELDCWALDSWKLDNWVLGV